MFNIRLLEAIEIFVLVSLAAMLVWLGTINGAGLSPDSVSYIKIALRISEGSIDQVGAHWPPLYPALIAAGFADNLFENARWISIVSIVGLVFVTWAIVNRAVEQPVCWYLRPAVLLLLIVNTALLKSYWMAWSEGIFIALLACAIYAFMRYTDSRQQRWFTILVLVVALLPLVRYAGVAFVGAFVVAVYWYSSGTLRQRLYQAGILAFCAIIPVFVWLSQNYIWHGSTAERSFVYHPMSLETLKQGLTVFGDWIVGSEMMLASTGYFLLLLVAAWAAWKTARPLLGLLVLIPACYLLFLSASISFIDAYTPLDHRILAPLFLPFVLLIPLVPAAFELTARRSLRQSGVACLMLLMLLLELPNLNAELGRFIRQGEGYAHHAWRYSPSLAYAQRLGVKRQIYTNSPEALLVHLGREEKMLPLLFYPSTSLLNEQFSQQMAEVRTELLSTNGVVILFVQLAWRSYLPSAELLISEYGFELLATTADGIILGVSDLE